MKLYVIHPTFTMVGEFPTEMWRPSRTICAPASETSVRSNALTDCGNCIEIVRKMFRKRRTYNPNSSDSQNLLSLLPPVLTPWILSQASHSHKRNVCAGWRFMKDNSAVELSHAYTWKVSFKLNYL